MIPRNKIPRLLWFVLGLNLGASLAGLASSLGNNDAEGLLVFSIMVMLTIFGMIYVERWLGLEEIN